MKRKLVGLAFAAIFLCAAVFAVLFYRGVLLLNNPSEEEYPVRGVDVSSYQGKIEWDVLADQKIQFAFLKATEGSSMTDPYFAENFAGAVSTGLNVGAYHFFSYDSPGETQAAHFISVVPRGEGLLPPVVDVEFYGDKEKNPPQKDAVHAELTALVKKLEGYYGVKPILYATEKSYALFLAGAFDQYDIWIRNVVSTPSLSDGRSWRFWQYTNRAVLPGYQGKERYIDLNVFHGSREEFEEYLQKNLQRG